jgi:hypothetical protein
MEDLRPRLARLGHPDELTGMEPPRQRVANYLIAAERELSHVQTRCFEARRGGDPDVIAAAVARQDAAEAEIGRLRFQLYGERRRELLRRRPQGPAPATPLSLVQRFFGR